MKRILKNFGLVLLANAVAFVLCFLVSLAFEKLNFSEKAINNVFSVYGVFEIISLMYITLSTPSLIKSAIGERRERRQKYPVSVKADRQAEPENNQVAHNIADLSNSIKDKNEQNSALLQTLCFVKCYKRSIESFIGSEIEIQMEELYKNNTDYYLRIMYAYCAAEANGRPDAHIFECLYKIDNIDYFDYDGFSVEYHYDTKTKIHLLGESENGIIIMDDVQYYGYGLPEPFYNIQPIEQM